MARCIYTGADEHTATFNQAEHIFPKCIGGVNCLPKGWVSDDTNAAFSKLELGFGRTNPLVAIQRMFLPSTGRKKHHNRDRVGIFKSRNDDSCFELGYIRSAVPFPLDQIVVTADFLAKGTETIPVRVVLPHSSSETYELQIEKLWDCFRSYSNSPYCIKDKRLPAHTYLLGCKDRKWFLGISEEENPEIVKPHLQNLVEHISKKDTAAVLYHEGKTSYETHQVEAIFSFAGNYPDYLRVYAKIAVNCFAALKGVELACSEGLNGIKRAILTGENIEEFVWQVKGPEPIPVILRAFPERLKLGKLCHSATFLQKEGCLYGIISLYGMGNPMIVKLGNIEERVAVDEYICDWENHVDYTMTDCAIKICQYDEDEDKAPEL